MNASTRRGAKPLGALVSQGTVAGSSLVLSIVALRALGAGGLGAFSLLVGILTTLNAVQSGWIGDSLTVLDRFDPGIRRALFQSQGLAIVIVGIVSTVLATFVGGVDGGTALLFGLASVMWIVEETLRRILIARREFWKLAANDGAFAIGSLGFLVAVAASGAQLTLQTLVGCLLAGALVAILVGVIQLPGIELAPGFVGRSRMRELASFAVWRAVQIGLRPGTQSLVRAMVAAAVSLEAVGRLEAARLLLAPVLTVINGAGVYLLPTYASQVKRRVRFSPNVVAAMAAVAGLAALYGAAAMLLRSHLVGVLTDGSTAVSLAAIASWTGYSAGFGAGIPVGSAVVAQGRSRLAFACRLVDAVVGVALAGVFVAAGWVSLVPTGLAIGAFLGALLLLASLRSGGSDHHDVAPADATTTAALYEAAVVAAPEEPELFHWQAPPPGPPTAPARRPTSRSTAPAAASAETVVRARPGTRSRSGWSANLLWLAPLVLIVATEYKVRKRSIDEVLDGRIDPLIAVELGVYAAIGCWALWRLIPRRPKLQPLTMLMWGYLLTTSVSAMYSNFPMLAMARGVQLIVIGAVIQLLAADGTLRDVSRLVHGWVVLMSASVVAGILYVAPVANVQKGRFTWLSVHSVSAGSMLAISVPILFGLWIIAGRRTMPWPRWLYGLLFAAHTVFLVMTRTRGSIAGGLLAVAVIAWVSSGRRMKPELALASLVGGGALALSFGGPVLGFLMRGETAEQLGTFNRRTEIWTLAWQSFLDHPVFGLGFASAKGVFFDETGLGGAHNAAVNVMIDVGLFGLLWWTALIVGVLATLGRLWSRERHAAVLLPGATSTMRSDLVIVLGVMVASLVNSITTEGLGAGVNVSAIWLFVVAAWLTILQQAASAPPAAYDPPPWHEWSSPAEQASWDRTSVVRSSTAATR